MVGSGRRVGDRVPVEWEVVEVHMGSGRGMGDGAMASTSPRVTDAELSGASESGVFGRTAGTGLGSSGRLLKGRPLSKEADSLPFSSIPTKYETLLTKTDMKKGFSSTTPRFAVGVRNELPGPGAYFSDERTSFLMKTDSLSKKGYGNGFVSRTERLSNDKVIDFRPAPGQYEPSMPRNPVKGPRTVAPTTAVFAPPSEARRTQPPGFVKKPTPGPGEHDQHMRAIALTKGRSNHAAPLCNFISKTDRFGVKRVEDGRTAPGQYDPNMPQWKPHHVADSGEHSSFKSGTLRTVPGIGSGGFRTQEMDPESVLMDRDEASARGKASIGPGSYENRAYEISTRVAKESTRPSSFLARTESDRFGRPTTPRAHRTAVPGPGAHEVQVHALPQYDIRHNLIIPVSNGQMSVRPTPSAAFKSTSVRGIPGLSDKKEPPRAPGPAYYRPGPKIGGVVGHTTTCFNQNLSKKFMP